MLPLELPRKTDLKERTLVAPPSVFRQRGHPPVQKTMHICGDVLRNSAETLGYRNDLTPLLFSIKERALWNRHVEHFLQTKSLSTQLHEVPVLHLPAASFVLVRVRLPPATCLPMKLHHVSLACKTQFERTDRKSENPFHVFAFFRPSSIYTLMENPSLSGKHIIFPDFFQMD